jgi:hypothetical protein
MTEITAMMGCLGASAANIVHTGYELNDIPVGLHFIVEGDLNTSSVRNWKQGVKSVCQFLLVSETICCAITWRYWTQCGGI